MCHVGLRGILAAALLAMAACASASRNKADPGLVMIQVSRLTAKQQLAHRRADEPEQGINVCYFTNWARYRGNLINQGKDIFELGLRPGLCSHFMYGFATVTADFDLKSNDPNADHPSGSEAQDGLCAEACNDPGFTADWSDPNGQRCDWPCSPTRVMRGYEGLTVGMRARDPSIKALISVGGWNFNDCAASPAATVGQGSATCEIFSAIASSEANIRKFAQNVIAFCRKWGFDGFDLDWEYPVVAGHNSNTKVDGAFQDQVADYENYITMLRVMKEEFLKESSSKPLLLTAAVGVGKHTVDTAYNIPEMSKHLDLINLMTYDLHGAWESQAACNANLYATPEDSALGGGVGAGEAVTDYPLSVSWAVDYWIDHGASPAQLTLGLATYGRGWKLSDPSNSAYNAPTAGASTLGVSTKEAGYKAYYEIKELLRAGKATRHYDADRECPFVVTEDGEWIGYDDEQSLRAKVEFAKTRGLRGTMVWALDLDDFDGEYSGGVKYPLLAAIREGLDGAAPGTGQTSAPPTTASPAASTAVPPTTVETTTAAPVSTTASAPTPAPGQAATSTRSPTAPPTSAPTEAPVQQGSCVPIGECSSAWCQQDGFAAWCMQMGAAGNCPQPLCTSSGSTTTPALPAESTAAPTAPTTLAPPAPATPSPPVGEAGCVRNEDCAANAWCQDDTFITWCAAQGDACPAPHCVKSGSAPSPPPAPVATTPMPAPGTTLPSTPPSTMPASTTMAAASSTAAPAPPPTSPPVLGNGSAATSAVLGALRASDSSGVFMYDTGSGWLESDIYTWPDMAKAVELMATTGVGKAKLWLGDTADERYGLVNIAAFLAQCMQETIQYNACDENNWSDKAVVQEAGGSTYSSTAACGQLHQSYQNYQCSAEEDDVAGGQMACDADPEMEMRATTQAGWYGAPAKLFCAPKSKVPKAPRWDASGPWCAPEGGWGHVAPFAEDVSLDTYFDYVNGGGSCKDYGGIKTGGWKFDGEGCVDGACPGSPAPLFGEPEGRTDVEGCCWWGRGVIQTTGTCNFGKLNFYMGKRAAREGRPSIYPDIDFCRNPGAICEPGGPSELKWVAGFFYWLNAVQPYASGGWKYLDELKRWVDGGMDLADTAFINGASGIVNRGCHNPPHCGTGELHGGQNRVNNFVKVLKAMGVA